MSPSSPLLLPVFSFHPAKFLAGAKFALTNCDGARIDLACSQHFVKAAICAKETAG